MRVGGRARDRRGTVTMAEREKRKRRQNFQVVALLAHLDLCCCCQGISAGSPGSTRSCCCCCCWNSIGDESEKDATNGRECKKSLNALLIATVVTEQTPT